MRELGPIPVPSFEERLHRRALCTLPLCVCPTAGCGLRLIWVCFSADLKRLVVLSAQHVLVRARR